MRNSNLFKIVACAIEDLNCIFVEHNYRTENTLSASAYYPFLLVFSTYFLHCFLLFLTLFFLVSVPFLFSVFFFYIKFGSFFHHSRLIHGLFTCFFMFSFFGLVVRVFILLFGSVSFLRILVLFRKGRCGKAFRKKING